MRIIYGAKKFDRVKRALKLGIMAATAIACIGFVVMRLFPCPSLLL